MSLAGPVPGMTGARPAGSSIEPAPKLSPEHFRCILVGDSQTTGPNAERVRTQTHRWDAPIIGEQVSVGAGSTGFLVNNGNGGIPQLLYRNIDLDSGWPDGGSDDFFGLFGANWTCLGDIIATESRIGRYRLRFNNTDAPWDEAWGVGAPLVARIAVRTGPLCIDAIETRPERGGMVSTSDRRVHLLSKVPGVQIIEQPIPVDFNPAGDDVGVGLFFPPDFMESEGQVLQVLGVVIERVAPDGRRLPGTLITYQGRGGWNMTDHIDGISIASRAALAEMTDADHVIIMLGHNREPGGEAEIRLKLSELVGLWEQAYAMAGRSRPTFIYTVPWSIFEDTASDYLLEMEAAMTDMAAMHRGDLVVNYLSRYAYQTPDVFDPGRYQLDGARVHPADIVTAENLAQDLYDMLFNPRLNGPAERLSRPASVRSGRPVLGP
ncbi:MAG: hypothetical protein CMJ25_14440 [Phycisphaerae bacterium]|nr:hypothetical protein [Phycisphaerae bacterium]